MTDREVSNVFNRIKVAILCGTTAATAVILIAGIAITIAPQSAKAKPEFTGQTGKACVECHQNPSGGGKLTPAGEKFKQEKK